MLSKIKNTLIGTPLPTHQLAEKRLNKIRALATFSAGALSSIAYANQEIYLGLLLVGAAGLGLALPIGLAITVLLVVLPSPYRSIISPLLDYLDEDDLKHNDGTQAAVILPEFIPAKVWEALLYRRRIRGFQRIIIDVPYHLKK